MTPKDANLAPALHDYLVRSGNPPDEHQRRLIEATTALGPIAAMQIAPEQGAFMTMLVQLLGATTVVEVGTFTGYSTLCLARGLATEGRVIACDISEEWTSIGREAWAAAGVADRIDLRLAPALETLRALPTEPLVDLVFIDADKGNYRAYYEEILPRVRANGLLLIDNVLWSGKVIDETVDDPDTVAIRSFNDAVAHDDRVEVVMLPIADGLSLIRKK